MRGPELRLFLLGFLTLFMELLMIRYLAGSIWNLGYFPNLVLLAVFVGMGLGFNYAHRLSEKRSDQIFLAVPWLVLLLVVFVAFLHPGVPGFGAWGGDSGGELFFTAGPKTETSEHLGLFLLWFGMLVTIFGCVSQKTAQWFAMFPPLKAYTLDIGGSCLGILAFIIVSFGRLPAWSWFLALLVLFGGCLVRPFARAGLTWWPALLICALAAGYQDRHLEGMPHYDNNYGVIWSPYQRIGYVVTPDVRQILVNGLAHQHMDSVQMIMNPNNMVPYSVPYLDRAKHPELPPYKRVLILGAGSSNDVTSALLHGAEHVDAVDIDPVIMQLGQRYHPSHAYDDPRVSKYVDDGRAFLTRSHDRYDLIIFALTDSLVKVSPMSQLRLENYLFTEDSVRKAFSLLNKDGSVMFYNFYRYPWLVGRIEQMIIAATGHAPTPLLLRSDFQMLLVSQSSPPATLDPAQNPSDLPTDDWPFLYLRGRGVPLLYQYAGATVFVMVLCLMALVSQTTAGSPLSTRIAFALMGTAFMLLESKTVIQFSLLFGTTWLNNSLVFLAVLLMVLAANWCAQLFRVSRPVLFAVLMITCLVPLAYPMANLLAVGNPFLRFLAGSLLAFSPIFCGNLLFSSAFRDQPKAAELFGWNLIGASLGGILEYSSLAVGYNALAVLVALCYVGAFVALSLQPKPAS